jgi:hypothetical protein
MMNQQLMVGTRKNLSELVKKANISLQKLHMEFLLIFTALIKETIQSQDHLSYMDFHKR